MENSSQLPTSPGQVENRFRDRLALSQIFSENGKYGEIAKGQYIEVRVLWTSGVNDCTITSMNGEKRSFQGCNFIFSDDSGHIAARINFKTGNINGMNICQLLKPGRQPVSSNSKEIKQVAGFSITRVPYNPITLESNNFLREQHKRLVLSDSSRDIKSVSGTSELFTSCLSYIPYNFMDFAAMENAPWGSSVDWIGYVLKVDSFKKKEVMSTLSYQKILTKSTVESDKMFYREITIFDDHIGKVKENVVYAFSNLKVGYFRDNVSLKSTFRTIITEISELKLKELLPPKYFQHKLVTDLFPGMLPEQEGELSEELRGDGNGPQIKRPRRETEDEGYVESPGGSYDFRENKTPLKVAVRPAEKFMDIGENVYSMRSKQRGVALIIFNYDFPMRGLSGFEGNRVGGENDPLYIYNFLRQCGNFHIDIQCNVESGDLEGAIQAFKEDVEEHYRAADCCIVAVFSHGSFGTVEMVDEKDVNLYDQIIFKFDEHEFPCMKGKPKIFILQLCQDFPENKGFPIFANEHQRNKGGVDDMIICFPTTPGSAALRDIYLGSHFIYVLVDVLMRNAHDTDFVQMMQIVQANLKKVVSTSNLHMICWWGVLGFNKKLYFNPGL